MCGNAKHDKYGNHIDEDEVKVEPVEAEPETAETDETESTEDEALDVTEEIADLVTDKVLVE